MLRPSHTIYTTFISASYVLQRPNLIKRAHTPTDKKKRMKTICFGNLIHANAADMNNADSSLNTLRKNKLKFLKFGSLE